MGCNGSNVFQSVRVGVTTQMKENVAWFFLWKYIALVT
jgi:hypothetical protein